MKYAETRSNSTLVSKKSVLHRKYVRYLLKTNTIVIVILSAVDLATFHLSSTIITYVYLFGYVIYSSVGLYC